MPVSETSVFKHGLKRNIGSTVQRSEYQWNVQVDLISAMDAHGLNLVQIGSVIFRAQNNDFSLFNIFIKVTLLDVSERINSLDFFGHAVSYRTGNLTAVFPICLITVVFSRVM